MNDENKVYSSELIHIWKCQPCEAGDTLSGGERVALLTKQGLITPTTAGYIVTEKGAFIVQRMFEYLDKLTIRLSVDISVFKPNEL